MKIRNAVAGDRDHLEIVFFDCRKGRFNQSVLAVRGLDEGFRAARSYGDLTTELVEDWTLAYCSKKLLLPGEIETLLFRI